MKNSPEPSRLLDTFANTPFSRKVGSAVIAHRAIHSKAIKENSLAAIEMAVKFGVAAEIDVFFTSSHESVLLHGPVLAYQARKLSQNETLLSALPRLEEALALVNGRIPLLLDLKHLQLATEEARQRFAEIVRPYAAEHSRLVIASFNPNVLEFRSLLPDILFGLIAFGFNLDTRLCERFDFLVLQKDMYQLLKPRVTTQKPTLLWTYKGINYFAPTTTGMTTVRICNITEADANRVNSNGIKQHAIETG